MCDIYIPKSSKWWKCAAIYIDPLLQIVENADTPIRVTVQSQSGCMGHVNLYYGIPGTSGTQCVINPNPLILDNTGGNSEPIVSVPAYPSQAYDSASFLAGSVPAWPSTVMIVAKVLMDQSSNCPAGVEPPGWDALNNPQIACCEFAMVTQAMVRANLSVLLPPLFEKETEQKPRSTAFAMRLTSGRRYGSGRTVRTALRAIVIGNEKREKHIDHETRELILGRARDEKRGLHGRWTPLPKVRLALGKERLFVDGSQNEGASLGHTGPISPDVMHHLVSGPSWESERDIQIDLPLDPGEVRQALIEVPVPAAGEYHVVRLLHQDLESGAILQQRTLIVEPRPSGLRDAPDKAAE